MLYPYRKLLSMPPHSPLEIAFVFLNVVLGMESNASYVGQVLCHLATPLAPKPIFRTVSIIIYFFF